MGAATEKINDKYLTHHVNGIIDNVYGRKTHVADFGHSSLSDDVLERRLVSTKKVLCFLSRFEQKHGGYTMFPTQHPWEYNVQGVGNNINVSSHFKLPKVANLILFTHSSRLQSPIMVTG